MGTTKYGRILGYENAEGKAGKGIHRGPVSLLFRRLAIRHLTSA